VVNSIQEWLTDLGIDVRHVEFRDRDKLVQNLLIHHLYNRCVSELLQLAGTEIVEITAEIKVKCKKTVTVSKLKPNEICSRELHGDGVMVMLW